jgi:hypothetical protein
MRKLAGVVLVAVCLALSSGCGASQSSAEGAVTYDGQPVTSGVIAFVASDGKAGGGGGGTILDGRYKTPPEVVLKPGKYRVEIRWARPTGKKVRSETGDELNVTEEGLPEKYNNKSELTADIKAGSNTIDFNLPK